MIDIAMLRKNLDLALKECDAVMVEGEKTHGEDEWRKGDLEDRFMHNIQHAIDHIDEAIKDSADDVDERVLNLTHAVVRFMMSLQLLLEEKERISYVDQIASLIEEKSIIPSMDRQTASLIEKKNA